MDRKKLRVLMEDAGVENEEREAGGDAEEEAAHVHARMDGAGVTDADDEERGVRQYGENKPANDENLRGYRAPAPARRDECNVSQRGGAQRENGAGGHSVATRETNVGMQANEQESDGVFEQHDEGHHRAIARRRQAEEMRIGIEDRRDERIRESSDAECGTNRMPARSRRDGCLCGIG